jgi:uncharacterized protein (DUF427 family)
MALTLGSGPFGHHPGGELNSRIEGPAHKVYFEDHPRRMRAVVGGEKLIDTVRAKLLYESGIPPVLYVPLEDVRADLIERTGHSSHCPFKGDAAYWTIRAGGKVVENALWGYPDPVESAPWLRGYVAPYWHLVDAWFEEDEQLIHRIRDPYHRVEVLDAAARVTVRAQGEVIAESTRPKLVFETSHDPVAYIPVEDIRDGVLVPSEKTSACPYKGSARYWSLQAAGGTIEDAAWSYEEPFSEAARAAGLVSFAGEGVEVEIDRSAARDLRAAA